MGWVYALPGGELPVPVPSTGTDARFTRTPEGDKRFDVGGGEKEGP